MQFKTAPYAHQLAAFERSAEAEYFALTMEQGTGKTKVVLDSVAHLYNIGRANALLVLAPNGVHRDWIRLAIPKHLPDYVPRLCSAWSSTASKQHLRAYNEMLRTPDVLRVFTVNIEALAVPRVMREIELFLDTNDAFAAIDESTTIKNPKSKRTENALKLRPRCKYRRILTGTPVTQSPLDVFAQYSFLHPDILRTHSYTVFRARYAELLQPDHPLLQHIVRTTGKRAPAIIARDENGQPIYKNLDELKALVEPHTHRVLKKDCLDLPPKVYVRVSLDMSSEQEKAYHDLLRRLKTGLRDGDAAGKPVTKLNSIMYLQRILCGVMPGPMTESGNDVRMFEPKNNPRVRALLRELEESAEQAIIWCRFTEDILAVTEALVAEYGPRSVVQYYGDVKDKERDIAVARFAANDARFFVGNQQAGGKGLDGLQVAEQVHYFSNSFKLEDRLQSEDRAHRIGQKKTVRYVDYEVEGTVDSKIVHALLNKKDVADAITGDEFQEWIS